MDCCELANAIDDARKQLRRLEKNQLNPDKQRSSAFEYWWSYSGHLIKWANYQSRLKTLTKAFEDQNCHNDIGGSRQYLTKDYPAFDWEEFKRRWREGIKFNLLNGPPRPHPGDMPIPIGPFGGVGGPVPVGVFP